MTEVYAVINSADHGQIEFYDPDNLREFLNSQLGQFEWVQESDPRLYGHLQNLINNALSHIGSGALQGQLDNTFMAYRFPVAGSDFAAYIEDIHANSPPLAGLMLSAVTRAINFDLAQWPHLRALGALIAFDQKLTPKSVEAAQTGFKRAVTSYQRQESAARGRGTSYENRIAQLEVHSSKITNLARRYVAHKLRIQRKADTLQVQQSVADMEATKTLYMEHMALKAPVEYWSKKATAHSSKAVGLRSLLVKFAGVGGSALVLALTLLAAASILVISAGVPSGVLFVLATIGVVLTTIVFWAGRILTRLYLSELHLSIDAGERATMVETYLALTSVGQASTEDRAIILASLFRPTADGIVKDDAAPEFSPASILAKAVTPG